MTLKNDIIHLRSQGLTYNQIVQQLGCAKSTVAYYCGEGQQEKQARRNKDKRSLLRRYLQEAKNGACTDCGVWYPYFVMEFDHLPQFEKVYTIARLNEIPSLDALKEEISKCELVCSNCHAFRSWYRQLITGDSV